MHLLIESTLVELTSHWLLQPVVWALLGLLAFLKFSFESLLVVVIALALSGWCCCAWTLGHMHV